MSSTGSTPNAEAMTSPAQVRDPECMVYRGSRVFQDEDGLWCWYDPVFGVRSHGEFWSLDSAQRDIDHYRVQTIRAH
jgi:hypothetical protein